MGSTSVDHTNLMFTAFMKYMESFYETKMYSTQIVNAIVDTGAANRINAEFACKNYDLEDVDNDGIDVVLGKYYDIASHEIIDFLYDYDTLPDEPYDCIELAMGKVTHDGFIKFVKENEYHKEFLPLD